MKNTLICLGMTLFMLSCHNNEQLSDAYGNFEATEITVSAETAGKIKFLQVVEGETVQQGQYIGLIDTTQLHLRKQQLKASAQTVGSRSPGITSQVAVLLAQQRNARQELRRFRALAEDGAATQKQVDDLQARVSVLEKQIQAAQTQNDPLLNEIQMIQVQIKQVEDQIQNAHIEAPITGKVLLKLAEAGEIAHTGTPLFRMASLDTLTLRVYVSGSQLAEIKLGEAAGVLIDQHDGEYKHLEGRVTWIADQAEFTPKVIQTRDERVDLVYAVKVRVPNDGSLKIGMPGEVNFHTNPDNLAKSQ